MPAPGAFAVPAAGGEAIGVDRTVKEACGVFGVFAPGRVAAHLTFDGIYALQHRGQESAGMAVSDGDGITVVKDMGLVTAVFDERKLSGLPGHLSIGHTRYSTHGSSEWSNAQPVFRQAGGEAFALGHNGNLTDTQALAHRLGMLAGIGTSDSDLMAELLARAMAGSADSSEASSAGGTNGGPVDGGAQSRLAGALRQVVPELSGAFSLVLLDATRLYGIRDAHGFRPLCLGRLGPPEAPEGWALASESPALDIIGATFVRELEPGELVTIGEGGVSSEQLFAPGTHEPHLCMFELVYFARPDARLYGREVHGARRRMGELLAEQAPVAADLVVPVPESGVPAAEGYARRSGIPYGQGLVKNRYIGRTFIDPDQQARVDGVRRKLNPLQENVAGKRLIVVDDSIVRGTTPRAIVRMLRDAGATEVHLRISSPPFRWPCFYGIDTPTRDELLAAYRDPEEIERFLGADSLAYLELDSLKEAIDAPGAGFCDACFTGNYPTPVPVALRGSSSAGEPGERATDGGEPATREGDHGPVPAATRPAGLQAALPGV